MASTPFVDCDSLTC